MNMEMARIQLSVTDSRQAALWLDEIVTDNRNRGYTRERAVDLAADFVGITRRRVKAILYGEPVSLSGQEVASLRSRFAQHLETQADDLARRSEQARARRLQMEIDL